MTGSGRRYPIFLLLLTFVLQPFLALPGSGAAGPAAVSDTCKAANPYGSPAERVADCNGGYADLQRLARALGRRFGLPEETARRFAAALAHQEAVYERHWQGLPVAVETLRRIEPELLAVLREAAENAAVVQQVARFYFPWSEALGDTPSPALLDLVRQARDPAGLAFGLAGEKRIFLPVLLAVLERQPAPPLLWQKAAAAALDPAWEIAFREQALRIFLAARPERAASPVALALAGGWLEALFAARLPRLAAAAYHALPAEILAGLLAGVDGAVEAEVEGLPFAGTIHDLRLPLAAACQVAGDRAAGAEILARYRAAPSGTQRPGVVAVPADWHFPAGRTEAIVRLLARALAPQPPTDDPFELLTHFLALTDGQDATSTVSEVAAGMAEREGYPAIAAYLARRALAQRIADPAPWQPAGLPAPLLAQGRRLAARIAARQQEMENAAQAGAAPGTDPGAAVVARSLGAPRLARFAEHRLPVGLAPSSRPRRRRRRGRRSSPPPGASPTSPRSSASNARGCEPRPSSSLPTTTRGPRSHPAATGCSSRATAAAPGPPPSIPACGSIPPTWCAPPRPSLSSPATTCRSRSRSASSTPPRSPSRRCARSGSSGRPRGSIWISHWPTSPATPTVTA